MLFKQVEQRIGLFLRVVGGVSLRAITFEEMRMRTCYDMAKILLISPLQCLAKPLQLFAAHCAVCRIIDHEQVLLSRRSLYDEVVVARLEILDILWPLFEINIVVACYSHQCILFRWIERHCLICRVHLIEIVLRIDDIAQMHSNRTQRVLAISINEVCPARLCFGHMGVGAYIHAIVIHGCLQRGKTMLVIIYF